MIFRTICFSCQNIWTNVTSNSGWISDVRGQNDVPDRDQNARLLIFPERSTRFIRFNQAWSFWSSCGQIAGDVGQCMHIFQSKQIKGCSCNLWSWMKLCIWPVLYISITYEYTIITYYYLTCYYLLLLFLLFHCYYNIFTHYCIFHYYILLLFLLLHCYCIIITYYYIIHNYVLSLYL